MLKTEGKSQKIFEKKSLKNQALDFIMAGVGCNCLVALSESGVLERLVQTDGMREQELEVYDNPIALKSALVTLEKCGVVEKIAKIFKITKFGRTLAEYIGLITIFFDGYANLVANQSRILKKKIKAPEKLVRWPVISKSSVRIAEKAVNPILIEEVDKLGFSGTICDLGCGHGATLTRVCKRTGNPGLGFEGNSKTVFQARRKIRDNIAIEVADITKLRGMWEDVVVLMQAFVFHDFVPESECISILDSYLDNFPNLKCFFYVDIVAPCSTHDGLYPGFDYVHGLLGIPTRTYEETLEIFEQSKFKMVKEIPIPDLPNTFLWVLSP